MVEISKIVNTDGKGLWSNVAKKVQITGLELAYIAEDNNFGELRVYFDTDDWNTDVDGLIYTDDTFLSKLKSVLRSLNINDNIEYSEQGMQGFDFVSFDVGGDFIQSALESGF